MPDGGVYALSLESGPGIGFVVPVQPIVKNGTTGLMHIARAGAWKGHPSGPFEFTAELFDDLISRFERRESRALLVDYNHNSERSNEVEASRAGGWIRSLFRKGDGDDAELWAVVEFTARAAEMITAGELLFCSPVVAWDVADTRDAKLGPELISAALTNQPFQDHLKAIALSRRVAAAMPPMDGEGDEEEPAEEGAPAQEEPPATDAGNTPPAQSEGPADPLMTIATALGVDHATVCAVVEANKDVFVQAIGDALEKQRKEQTMQIPQTKAPPQETQLSADQRISALEKTLADERLERRFDALVSAGRATLDMKQYVMFELARDPEAETKKFSEQVVPVGQTQAGNRDQVTHKVKVTELSAEERVYFDAVTSGSRPLMKKDEALNRLVARRERAEGKAA